MPALSVNKRQLCQLLEFPSDYDDERFSELFFDFGLELDDIITEITNEVENVTYKIDVPANRYDLLCIEGLKTALLAFNKKIKLPEYVIIKPAKPVVINNYASSSPLRPYVIGAILRGTTLTEERYNSFIDLQDKLHNNIGRKRTLVAIGTHDLDSVKPPFHYKLENPENIRFQALNQPEEHTAAELIKIYENHPQLKQYLSIIGSSPQYPVIRDSTGVVLSLPPIINGHHSRITLNTKNIFIECTATDKTKAIIVLDTLVSMFSEYCDMPYEVVSVTVENKVSKGVSWFPEMKYRRMTIGKKKINSYLGTSKSTKEIVDSLERMGLFATPLDKNESSVPDVTKLKLDDSFDEKENPKPKKAKLPLDNIAVIVPPTRHDILHICDLIEDVAIAIGYNNIAKELPATNTLGSQLPLNKLTEDLREHVAYKGFTEALTFSLCSRDDIGLKLQKNIAELPAVHVSNPKTLEFQVARTTLIPGLLKTVASNRHMPLPLKLFEVSDVVLKDDDYAVKARNERHLCAIYCGKTSGFEIIHGLLDKIMQLLQVPKDRENGYYIQAKDDSTFFPGRCAEIFYKQESIGIFGILHPEVITKFNLALPCTSLEFNIERFSELPFKSSTLE